MCWVSGAALFSRTSNLKGVTGALAAILLPKRKRFSEDRTHREKSGPPLKVWAERNHFVRTLLVPLCAAASTASIPLDVLPTGVS